MEALTSSSSKIFAEKNTIRSYLSSRTLCYRPQICFFRSRKLVSVDFSPSFPLHFKAVESLGSSCFSSEAQAGWETTDETDDQAQATGQSKTIHVRFQLQKECMFGQRFLLVGDDPIFGLWDPSDAIPLEWSDGHIWSVELDLPVGRTILFKFILGGTSGDFVWQPGPDRLVQIWETENTIIVSEDWENSEIQNITEEPVTNPITESVAIENLPYPNVEGVAEVNERLVVAENISCLKEEPGTSASSEMIDSEYTTHPKEDPVDTADNTLIVAENISYPKEYMVDLDKDLLTAEKVTYMADLDKDLLSAEKVTYMADLDKFLLTAENVTYSQQESMPDANKEFIIVQSTPESNGGVISLIEENQGIYEGGPVLVPGLTPLPTMTIEDSSPQAVEEGNNTDAPVQAGEADDNSAPEENQLPGKQEPGGDTHWEERNMMLLNDGPEEDLVDGMEEKPQITQEQDSSSQPTNGEDGDAYILQNDIQWGRNSLRKFLTSLGFL